MLPEIIKLSTYLLNISASVKQSSSAFTRFHIYLCKTQSWERLCELWLWHMRRKFFSTCRDQPELLWLIIRYFHWKQQLLKTEVPAVIKKKVSSLICNHFSEFKVPFSITFIKFDSDLYRFFYIIRTLNCQNLINPSCLWGSGNTWKHQICHRVYHWLR